MPARKPTIIQVVRTSSQQGEDLVGAYRASLQEAGMFAGPPTISVARMFFARVGVGGWGELSWPSNAPSPTRTAGSSVS
ncbi:MAG TPA: hypothetical protein VK988_15915 [Acidimicrobiales bacterium]|nr:hypothetical protein [Acidimicrobiales bacterium]